MLIFEHLSKTAGTTFHGSYLPAAFAPEQLLVVRGSADENAADLKRAVAMSGDPSRQPAIIAGHSVGMLREYFPQARFITLVREPVARAVSAYLHRVFHPGWIATCGAFDPSIMKLVDFVESDRFGQPYRNGQASLLLGSDFQELDDDAIRVRLAERYASVSTSERFDEFVFSLHLTEGLPLCLFNNRLVRRDRGGIEPTGEECAIVRSYNAVDLRLHRIVRDDFEKRCQALTPDQSAMLERYLRVLHCYREETHGDENMAVRLDEHVTSWDQGRLYYRLFGRFPTLRSNAVTRETLRLDRVTVSADAIFNVQGKTSATLTTSPIPWAYAATQRWPPHAQGLRLTLLIESGEMGIAVTDSDDCNRFLAQVSVGRTSAPIAVDLWPEGAPGMLILRNWSGGRFRAQLCSLQVLEAAPATGGSTEDRARSG